MASRRYAPEEIPEIVARAKSAGVHRMVTLATGEDDLQANVQLAEKHREIFAGVGIHPCDVHETREDFETLVEPHLANPRVVAVGETGLDYFHPAPEGWSEEDYRARQRDFLRRHFELAKAAGLNLVMHTRDREGDASFQDALAIYEDYSSEVRAVFHCFPGPWERAQQVLTAGGLVSYTGVVTFKKADLCLDCARETPLDRMMVETDAPYLAPTPHRGQRCEPAFTRETAERIATAKAVTLGELAEKTEAVCESFFRFPK